MALIVRLLILHLLIDQRCIIQQMCHSQENHLHLMSEWFVSENKGLEKETCRVRLAEEIDEILLAFFDFLL